MNREKINEVITYGCDPEFFIKQNGVHMPAEVTGVVGTKKEPMKLPGGGAVQIDGCALEFNIAPASNVDEFDKNIQLTIEDVRKIVSEDIEFDFRPDVTFTTAAWEKVSPDNTMLGCDPDYSAYTQQPKTPPAGAADQPFRTAAGHIHIGFTNADPTDPKHIFDCAMITQHLDRCVAYVESVWAPPSRRKQLYGEVGSFRPKPYGMEYRVLGNDWVNDPVTRRMVFCMVDTTVRRSFSGVWGYPVGKSIPLRECNMRTFLSHVRYVIADRNSKDLANAVYDFVVANREKFEKMGTYDQQDTRWYMTSIFDICGMRAKNLPF